MSKKILSLMCITALGLSLSVAALSLQEAKGSGRICELGNGFVQAKDTSPEVQSLVATTNAARSKEYEAIAAANGTSVDAVAKEAGASLGASCG